MKRSLILIAVMAFLAGLGPSGALAADDFDDLPTIAEAVNDALEFQKTGATVPWSSATTGNNGTITVKRTFFRGGTPCREYERTVVKAGVLTDTVSGTGCRNNDGIWSLDEGGGAASIVPASLPAPTTAPPVQVGGAEKVIVWAYQTPQGLERDDLYVRETVYSQELLETVQKGALHVRLLDTGLIRLGSESQVRLDEFVYDPASGAGKVTASIGRGVARFITGKVKGDNFKVRSPTALIGARGTDFVVAVAANGATIVHVNEGSVFVEPLGGAPPRALNRGQTMGIDPTGRSTTTDVPPPRDNGIGEPTGGYPTREPTRTAGSGPDPGLLPALIGIGIGAAVIHGATSGGGGSGHREPERTYTPGNNYTHGHKD